MRVLEAGSDKPVRSARVQDFWLGVALASHDSGRRDAIIGELRERAGDPKLAYRGHEKDQEQGGEPRLWLRLRATKQGLAKLQELRASGKLKRLRGRAVTSGIYFYRLSAGEARRAGKLTLVK